MKVLMVCLGNICRSPLAEGILKKKVSDAGLDWIIDSAGTGSWHIGEPPHQGSIEVAQRYDIDITDQRARRFDVEDFSKYDLIVAMDSQNYQDITQMQADQSPRYGVELMLNFSKPGSNQAVPDPYFTGDFNEVFSLLDAACEALLQRFAALEKSKIS